MKPDSLNREDRIVLRAPRAGDIGLVIHRHGVLYAEEYGWNEQFEALVAEVAAKFLKRHDSVKERCWIAELDGEFAGCIFIVRESEKVAKLRLLLVEPKARGFGLGRRLIQECIDFATNAGYEKMVLWTNDVLHAARHLYEEFGFHLIHEEPNTLFGPLTTAQTWERSL
ncbi:MAG: GNAT family N-acetyltransferase [Bacteroidota bacterium]|nr:GNAT family N-acetyltransferase [Bacteroidota bacterium]MDP4234562.1 GNAT family N-acetyltransferase [Bacteroidota bacterium]MDP4243691.1 GNAT family N-acetyltransferase [Bacteroidota bacterium]MDP4288361.1 GNAT family N-acetyltransferase [Bacteroidota bacterium]